MTPPSIEKPERPARLAYKLLLAVLATLIPLFLAEAGLRLFPVFRPAPRTYVGEYKNRPSKNFVVDPTTGWRMRPRHQFADLYRSNAQGFRSNEDFDPGEKRKKIAWAGDSFTFGVGVEYEQTYAALVQSCLPGSVVYNLAAPGFGLDQIWLSVRSQALPLKPNLVIVSFISGDLTRSQEAYRMTEGFNKPTFKLVDGKLLPKTPADQPPAVIRSLEHYSSLWRVARLCFRSISHYLPVGEWWWLNKAILDEITVDCRNRSVPLLFVYVPTKEWWRFPVLRSYMAEVGASFVDLAEGPHQMTSEMHLPVRNAHLNAKGHRQVAEAVLDWIHRNMPELE